MTTLGYGPPTSPFTTSGAIGRCWVYRVSFKACFWPKMKDAVAYMKKEKMVPVVVSNIGWSKFMVHDEPLSENPMKAGFRSWFLFLDQNLPTIRLIYPINLSQLYYIYVTKILSIYNINHPE